MTPRSTLLARSAAAIFFALAASAFGAATLDDTAKVLAGLPPSAASPLEPLTVDSAYKGQASMFAEMWRRFEEKQLSRVRAWADRELPGVRGQSPVLYYTFSGPDIVYANTFFPDCKTYVMCGLEPVGKAPDLLSVPSDRLDDALRRLYGSLETVLALGFFKTADMGSDFRNPDLGGITPVLMTFLGRLGKTVKSVDLVSLDREGSELTRDPASAETSDDRTPGVKIVFDSGQGTPEQTVYYFSTNISNEGLGKSPGFANFCRKLEPGAGLVKAASYLMHTSPFSATRDFLMERCKFILQDDTGIPAAVFAGNKWQMRPYGRYVRPIDMFRGNYQKKLAEIHAAGDGVPLDFGIGYYYRVADCNVLLASRNEDSIVVAAPAEDSEQFPEHGLVSDPDGFTHVRSGPGVEHRIVGVIQLDEPFHFRRDQNSWWRVKTGKGTKGFVHTSRISTRRSTTAANAAAPLAAAQVAPVAANEVASEAKSPRKRLVELEAEELRIRKDQNLTKKERMEKLREIWKRQLEVMGKKAA